MLPPVALRFAHQSHGYGTRVGLTRLGASALLSLLFAWTLVSADAADSGGLFFGSPPDPARSKHYYIAAEPTLWNYVPSGRDEMCGAQLPPSYQRERLAGKVRYFQYTDATFTTKVVETPSLGILGPVLRGVVGDLLVVTFLNRAGQPLSMHPHGVKYDKDSEGEFYRPAPGKGASVEPGGTFTYVWQLDEASGPRPDEPSSKAWLYHSHVAGDEEINQGLIGFIIVTDPQRARPDGTPTDVDRELATLFLIFDESGLGSDAKEAYEQVNNGSGVPVKSWAEIQERLEIGSRSAINGRTFANLAGLEMNEGERVRWYLFALGSQQDFHSAHWHGQRVLEEGRRRTDVIELMPASMKVADLLADNPGDWLFHCHVAEHMREGMFARMTVHPRDVVGADRSPAHAFLGLAGAANTSLRFTRAEVMANPVVGGSTNAYEIALEANATVFEAFSVFRQTVKVQLGKQTMTFAPDVRGSAQVSGPAGGTLRILNAGAQGVVYGGLMECAITLQGTVWDEELKQLGLSVTNAATWKRTVELAITIGEARHTASTPLVFVAKAR
ncbi:MAG: multicopper oxidase domain-containing protein [Opitutus sp.]